MNNHIEKIKRALNGNRWAFTGSTAMKMHAKNLGVNFPKNRKIGNINIAAEYPLSIIPKIARLRFKLNKSPKEEHTILKHLNNKTKVNLFKSGSRLAPNVTHIVFINGTPVMNINSLLNKKRNIINNNFKNNKTLKNIQFLELLKSESMKRSPRKPPSPKRSPSPRRSPSSRSPSPRRSLFFGRSPSPRSPSPFRRSLSLSPSRTWFSLSPSRMFAATPSPPRRN